MDKKNAKRLAASLKEVSNWSNESSVVRGHRFKTYLGGEGKVMLATTDLFDYGMSKVDTALLAATERASWDANIHMAHAFSRMLIAEILDVKSMKDLMQFISGSIDSLTHLLFGAIATGQTQLITPCYDTILEAMNGNYGVSNGHNPPLGTTLRYAAFGLSIIGDWLGKPLDLDKHALPRDPAWGQLVAHWREPDQEKFLPVILAACDTHVERIALTEKENDSGNFEFGSVFLAVHPTEILAILRLRDLLGLPNPAHIDHPLMQTPYAAITCLPGEVTERDELLENFLAVVRQRDPQVLPAGI